MQDVAVGGSTGGYYASPTDDYFGAQVTRFLSTNAPKPGDLTVVYFGYNDMTRWCCSNNPPALSKVLGDYHAALNRLIVAGYASEDRHIILVQGHDWGHTPRFVAIGGATRAKVRTNMQTWNAGVANMAAQHPTCVAADVFTPLECVFKQPKSFGFVDVSHELTDRRKAESFLYNYKDRYHFGAHGHRIIRQVISYYLTTGWDWSNTYKSPSTAKLIWWLT